MVGPDALLVALGEHPVRTRSPALNPPGPFQCCQHARCLGHVPHGRPRPCQSRLGLPHQRHILRAEAEPRCHGMKNFFELTSAPSHLPAPFTDQLRLAVAAYLPGPLQGFPREGREHTESDLRCYLAWCAERRLDPLAAHRPHLELHIRWMQEIRRFRPSIVSRRFSVTAGFCRTCVIDGILEHSPAEHVHRPSIPAESPTLGFYSPAVRGPADRRPGLAEPLRLRASSHARAARLADLRSHWRQHR
jgi:hypothetical protein